MIFLKISNAFFKMWIGALVAFFCLGQILSGQEKQEKRELKVIAVAGDWGSQFREGGETIGYDLMVFRKAPDKKTNEELVKALKVGKIDWEKQMVVVHAGGAGRTPRSRMEFQSIWLENGGLKRKLVDSGDEPECYKQHWALALTEKVEGKLSGKSVGPIK